MSMLEQMPGAHQLKQYSFKYNPPFDNSSLEETQVKSAEMHFAASTLERENLKRLLDLYGWAMQCNAIQWLSGSIAGDWCVSNLLGAVWTQKVFFVNKCGRKTLLCPSENTVFSYF